MSLVSGAYVFCFVVDELWLPATRRRLHSHRATPAPNPRLGVPNSFCGAPARSKNQGKTLFKGPFFSVNPLAGFHYWRGQKDYRFCNDTVKIEELPPRFVLGNGIISVDSAGGGREYATRSLPT